MQIHEILLVIKMLELKYTFRFISHKNIFCTKNILHIANLKLTPFANHPLYCKVGKFCSLRRKLISEMLMAYVSFPETFATKKIISRDALYPERAKGNINFINSFVAPFTFLFSFVYYANSHS